jgi:hemerythrin superfamily protein
MSEYTTPETPAANGSRLVDNTYARPQPVSRREDHSSSGAGGMVATGVLGFLLGMAFNPARKAAFQAAEAATGDWYDILKAEHHAVEKAFDKLLQTGTNETGKRQLLLTQIAHSLNKHAVTEENVIYPALRKHDAEAANELGHEHLDIKAKLSALQYDIEKDDPSWAGGAAELRDLIVEHARDEEERIYPPFRASMSDDENTSLNRRLQWEGLKLV